MLFRHILCYALCQASLLILPLSATAQVRPGIEVLEASGFKGLEGKRVALLTNPSGVDSQLRSTIDILNDAPQVNLVALFGPEHGVRGDAHAGDHVADAVDAATGLKVYSLYGANRQPSKEMLQGIDIVVYDIQDVGTRSYTFISTLGLMMRTCAQMGIEVMVLDRPNPLGGLKVEGAYVRDGYYSFVSQYKIPYIYGLTVGEVATMINEEGLNRGQKGNEPALKCKLSVVKMEGWRREMVYSQTGLPWVLPSPNIPTAESAICYPCAGLAGEFGSYLNIGIGYTLPFGVFAAEWIDADMLKAELDSYGVPGVAWRVIHYKPFFGSMSGKVIHGVQYFFVDYEKAPLTLIQFYVMQAVHRLYGRNPFDNAGDRLSMFNKVTGNNYMSTEFGKRCEVEDVADYWTADVEPFKELSKKYYLYQ